MTTAPLPECTAAPRVIATPGRVSTTAPQVITAPGRVSTAAPHVITAPARVSAAPGRVSTAAPPESTAAPHVITAPARVSTSGCPNRHSGRGSKRHACGSEHSACGSRHSACGSKHSACGSKHSTTPRKQGACSYKLLNSLYFRARPTSPFMAPRVTPEAPWPSMRPSPRVARRGRCSAPSSRSAAREGDAWGAAHVVRGPGTACAGARSTDAEKAWNAACTVPRDAVPIRDHRRQRGRRLRRLPRERSDRHLSDHPRLGDGRALRRMGGLSAHECLGRGAGRRRDAVRGRGGRRGSRRAPGGCPHDDVHGVAGAPADDPQPLQDRRRAPPVLLARRRAHRGHARALDLRRPLRRDGLPADRLRHAGVGLGAGSAGHGRHRARGHARSPASRSSTSSTASGPRTRSRTASCRSRTRTSARWWGPRRSPPIAPARDHAGPPGSPRHGGEPGHLLSGLRGAEPLSRLACPEIVQAHDGPLRRAYGPPLSPLRLSRPPRSRARSGHRRLGWGGRARSRRLAGRARRAGRRAQGSPLSPVRRRRLRCGLAEEHTRNRGPRSHEGARRRRRPALP